jgi:hypothetical protein
MNYRDEKFAPKVQWNVDTEKGTVKFTVDGLTTNYVMLPDEKNANHAVMRETCRLGSNQSAVFSLREIRNNEFYRHVLSTDLPPKDCKGNIQNEFVKNLGDTPLYLRAASLVTPIAQLN